MNKKSSTKKPSKRGKGKSKKIVMVSGGFDTVHIGHVRMFEEAKKLGDKLIVLLNNDNWLRLKKGYVFMPEQEGKEIIEAFHVVDEVVITSHKKNTKDISISKDLLIIRPHIFAKGGDRHVGNIPTPEVLVCGEIGCKIVNEVGFGGKVQSSSELVEKSVLAKIKRKNFLNAKHPR